MTQWVLDIPISRTNEGQKAMSFLSLKIWKKLSSNVAVATTTSLIHGLKNEIPEELQY